MNFQHVRAFCAIVAEGSFSRAADSLHLTQPTVSSQIQALEKELGTRLFDRRRVSGRRGTRAAGGRPSGQRQRRTPRGIALTQPGRVFHGYAVRMLELSNRAREAMEQLQGLSRGHLEIGASSVPGHYILPRVLVVFKASAPGIGVRLTVGNSHEIRAGVHESRFELGMVGEKARDERLVFEPVRDDRLVAAVRPEHPYADRESLTVEELERGRLIIRELGSGTRSTFERALARANVEKLKIWLELGSPEAIKMAIRAVDAVAVLSEWTIADEVQTGTLRAIPIAGLDLQRSIFLIWRAHGILSVASERFSELLRVHQAALPVQNLAR